jgi:hypothetical protein
MEVDAAFVHSQFGMGGFNRIILCVRWLLDVEEKDDKKLQLAFEDCH